MDQQRWMYEWHQGRPYLCPRRGRVIDHISNTRLAACHPLLVTKVNAAADALGADGVYFRVAHGVRTYADQDKLYAIGRTLPGRRVTDARGGYSNHNFGCAVDCFPFLHGSSGDLEMENPAVPVFVAMVAALKAQGLSWGGDWRKPDSPHFQLANAPVTPTDADRKAFAAGGLAAVWARFNDSTRGQTGNG